MTIQDFYEASIAQNSAKLETLGELRQDKVREALAEEVEEVMGWYLWQAGE